MAFARPPTAAAVFGITLVASAAGGYAWSVANGVDADNTGDSVSLDTPGVFEEPSAIPTAPQLEGDPLPDVVLADLSENPIPSSELIGRPAVINIWFSTCVPCKLEMPAFAEVHRDLGDEVRFIGLNYLESASTAEEFAAEYGAQYEQLLDTEGEFTNSLEIGNFPATLFVDSNGRIVELHQGALQVESLTATIREELLS
jgi:thiol-disulfide isomerase/thioredoxin